MEKDNATNDVLAQRRVLRDIIGRGITFTVSYTVKVRQKGFLGLFRPKVREERKEEFRMMEPTLAVLDRASEVWLRYNTESLEQKEGDAVRAGWKLAKEHSRDMAECIAILVLGEAYYAVDGGDDREIGRLTDLFYRTIKPSQCDELAVFVNTVSNITGFVSSMRLMKMSVTTTPPARIE